MQLTRTGIRQPGEHAAAALRREFDQQHCVRVRGFLEPALLGWIRAKLAAARFIDCVHEDLSPPAIDLLMADAGLHQIVSTLFNDERLFRIVEHLTGCDPIGFFQSRVYAMDPGGGHYDTWHGDLDGNRMIALSVNVGDAYEGGLLQIRTVGSDRVLYEVANTGAGDAVLFRLREDLEHYVTPVTGSRRKMAVAGWFQRTPKALDLIKSAEKR